MNLLNGTPGLFSLGQAGFMLLVLHLRHPHHSAASQRIHLSALCKRRHRLLHPELLTKPLGGFGLLLGVVFCLILAGFIAALFAFPSSACQC
ncbi:MAG: hypothetical protein ACLVJH_12580 [Faecalibacterium prausnitzii]